MEYGTIDKMRWEYIQSLRDIAKTDMSGPLIPFYTKMRFDQCMENGNEEYAWECLEWMEENFPGSDHAFNMSQMIMGRDETNNMDPDNEEMTKPVYKGKNRFYIYSKFFHVY